MLLTRSILLHQSSIHDSEFRTVLLMEHISIRLNFMEASDFLCVDRLVTETGNISSTSTTARKAFSLRLAW
jgi:hypothetical protein